VPLIAPRDPRPIAATAPLPDALAVLVGIPRPCRAQRRDRARRLCALGSRDTAMGSSTTSSSPVDASGGVIQVRSASRIGNSDFRRQRKAHRRPAPHVRRRGQGDLARPDEVARHPGRTCRTRPPPGLAAGLTHEPEGRPDGESAPKRISAEGIPVDPRLPVVR